MKKRILANILSLVMILSLLPATAMAVENDQAAELCAVTEGCTLAAGHDGECDTTPAEPEETTDGVTDPDLENGIMLTAGDEDVNAEQGTQEKPWNISAEGEDNHVTAYLSEDKTALTISGTGAMMDFKVGSGVNTQPWKDYVNQITSITLPEGLTVIGESAFDGFTQSITINIPDSVTEIHQYAFYQVPVTTELPANVKSIDKAFEGAFHVTVAPQNPYLEAENGVLYTKGKTSIIRASTTFSGEYKVPAAVQEIPDHCFDQATELTKVDFTAATGLTSIRTSAFARCSKLQTLAFPDCFTNGLDIGYSAFGGSNLTGTLTLPAGVTNIGQYAFNNNTELTEVKMLAGMTSIADYAFNGCSKLKTVTLSGNLKLIGSYVFKNTILDSIAIPASVTKINNSAFYELSTLKSVTFPEEMQGSLEIGDRAFEKTGIDGTLVLPEGLTKIGLQAFGNLSGVTSLILPANSLTQIGEKAFYNDAGIQSITVRCKIGNRIPGSVFVIGKEAFAYCDQLEGALYIEPGVTTIGKKAFYDFGGMKLSAVYLPSTITTVGFQAFYALDCAPDSTAGKAVIYCANDDVLALMKATGDGAQNYSARTTALANLKGGTVDAFDQYTKGTLVNNLTKEGYAFVGWYITNGETQEEKQVTTIEQRATGEWSILYPDPYIAKWTESAYSVNDAVSFDTLTYGTAPTSKVINVTASEVESPAVSSVTSSDSFTVTFDGMNITITPRENLSAGTYTETIVVTTGDGATHNVTVTLTVTPAPLTAPVLTNYTATTTSITVAAPTLPAGASKVQYSINNGENWQNSNVFSGLTSGTTYSVIAKFVADNSGNYTNSANSAALSVRTNSTGGGSSSGGSSSGSASYTVTVDSGKHGTVSVSPKNAAKGATVTITVKPDKGYELDDLTVTDKNGDEIKVKSKGDNKYTFTMPAGKVEVEASFAKIEEAPEQSFTDVPNGYWAANSIAWAYENGYMNGNTAATFNPEGTVTRQQLWMILARLSGYDPASMAEAKSWAVDNGLSDGTIPGGAVTRQQLVTILYRYAVRMGYNTSGAADLTQFPDHGSVASYAADAMRWSVANSIVGGTTQGTLNPTGTATRAQFAVILCRFCEGLVK